MTRIAPKQWLDAIRAADWWSYKIPPLLLGLYAGVLEFAPDSGVWRDAGLALLAILSVAVFGYVQNDICDIEADRRAGHRNRMAGASRIARTAWIVVSAAMALIFAAATRDAWLVALVGANLLVPTLYSVPPIRLKARGIAGLLADAAGVHVLPMAIVTRVVVRHAIWDGWAMTFVLSAFGWAAAAGLRGILVHQVIDRDADAAAGVGTWGGRLEPARARSIVMRRLLPIEIASLVIFLAPLLPTSPVLVAVLVLYGAGETVKLRRRWTLPLFDPTGQTREPYVPVVNNELYEMWLPVACAVQLAVSRPILWTVALAHVYLFLPNLRVRTRVALKVLEPSP